MNKQQNHASTDHNHFPWKHVIGFVLSIVMTLAAVWVALYTTMPLNLVLTIIVILAILQAGMQLFMFMHMTESKSGGIQTATMLYATFIAVAVVAGSIWVLTSFGHHMPM